MKKIILFIISVFLLLGLVACADPTVTGGDEETVHIHEYGEWTTTEPTCTTAGERTRSCSCGSVQRENLSAKGHTIVQVAAAAPTCDTEGHTAYWYCTGCRKMFSDRSAKTVLTSKDIVVPKTAHSLNYHKAIVSTCIKKGNIAYCDCVLCGKLFSVDEENTPLTEDEVFLPLLAHDMTHIEDKAASCTEEGVTGHWHCAICKRDYADEEGNTRLESTVIDKKAHSYVNGRCSVCGEKDSYTVHFSVDGGKELADLEVKKGETLPYYPVTAKRGNVFCGWYEQYASAPFLIDVDTVESDMTLYAHYVTSEEPFLSLPVTAKQNGALLADVSVTGYTKENVYNNAACTRATSFNVDITKDVLYIKYLPVTVDVEISAEGGYFVFDEQYSRTHTVKVAYFTEYTLPLPQKRGYTADGWTGAKEIGPSETLFMDGTETLSFSAKWLSVCSHRNVSEVAAVAATCTAGGNVKYYYCPTCEARYADEEYTTDLWDVRLPATGHSGGTANCKERAVCENCGEEYGEKIAHSGETATCVTLAVCDFCGEEYGEYRPHYGGTATCVALALCNVCGREYGEYGEHTAKDPVCEEESVCAVCDQVIGDVTRRHTYADGVCTYCGATEALAYTFDVDKGGYVVTGPVGPLTELHVPRRVDGQTVVGIGDGAFSSETTLTDVYLPSTLRYYGNNAFYDCTSLVGVHVDDLRSWQESVFFSAASNPLTYAKKLYVANGEVRSLTVPSGQTVSAYAYNNLSVTSVEVKEGVTYVGENAFGGLTEDVKLYVRDQKVTAYWHTDWKKNCSATVSYGYKENLAEGEEPTYLKNDFVYRLSGGKAVLVEYVGNETTVSIPEKIDGYPIVDVGPAFVGKSDVLVVFLPRALTAFSMLSFYRCNDNLLLCTKEKHSTWAQKGLPDDGLAFFTEENCVHDEKYLRYHLDGNGEPIVMSVVANEARKRLCTVDDPEEPLLCAVCGEPLEVDSTIERAHIYESGVCTVCGEKEPTAGLIYRLSDGGYSVVGFQGDPSGEVVFPSLLNGLPVREITEDLFRDYPNVTAVVLPRTIKRIGKNAFSGCDALRNVYFDAENCKGSSGETFFEGCTDLTVTIGKHAKSVPDHLFCRADVRSIIFENGSVCEKIGDFAFAENENLLRVELPASVKKLNFGAFRDCNGLIAVDAPQCELAIGRSAFRNCVTLSSFVASEKTNEVDPTAFLKTLWYENLADGVVYIGDTACLYKGTPQVVELKAGTKYVAARAFRAQTLTKIILPSSVLSIGEGAFADCPYLTEIVYDAENCMDLVKESSVFVGSGAETGISVSFGTAVKYIPAYLFDGAERITAVEVSAVEEVGKNAFAGTEWLLRQTGLVYVGKALYTVKGSAETVNIAEGTLSVADEALFGNTSVKTVTLPLSLKKLGNNALGGCASIETVTLRSRALDFAKADDIPLPFAEVGSAKGWTLVVGKDANLPAYLCYRAAYLKAVVFEEDSACSVVPAYAFAECPLLTAIDLPDSVATVADHAFGGSTSLKRVSFGQSLTSVSGLAFGACPLEELGSSSERFIVANGSLVLQEQSLLVLGTNAASDSGSVTAIAPYAFYERTGLNVFTASDEVISIGEYAFAKCADLASVVIGKKLTGLGGHAFSGCSGLKFIRYTAENCTDLTADDDVFEDMTDVTLYIGESVTYLPAFLFEAKADTAASFEFILIGREVARIGESCFPTADATDTFCYENDASDWSTIVVGANNFFPVEGDIWFYSSTPPRVNDAGTAYVGRYWRYVSGVITLWIL